MSEIGDGIGSIALGGLIAREVERAHAGAPALGHSDHEACPNCGAHRVGPYCHECGQSGHVHRNLMALVHDIAHGVFHFEGKVWHTLPLLALKPGELTRRYVHGERAKFISPMALFLFSVFLMFAVVANMPGKSHGEKISIKSAIALSKARTELATAQADLAKEADPEKKQELADKVTDLNGTVKALMTLQRTGAAVAANEKKPEADDLKDVRINTGWSVIDKMVHHTAANPDLVLYKMKSYGYKYSWALIPLSLPFIWMLFAFRRDVGLYDHAIFAIYSLSFMSLAVVALTLLGAIGLPSALSVLAVGIVPPLHMYKQLKGAYGLGRFGAFWRTCVLLTCTFIVLSLFMSLLFYLGND